MRKKERKNKIENRKKGVKDNAPVTFMSIKFNR